MEKLPYLLFSRLDLFLCSVENALLLLEIMSVREIIECAIQSGSGLSECLLGILEVLA